MPTLGCREPWKDGHSGGERSWFRGLVSPISPQVQEGRFQNEQALVLLLIWGWKVLSPGEPSLAMSLRISGLCTQSVVNSSLMFTSNICRIFPHIPGSLENAPGFHSNHSLSLLLHGRPFGHHKCHVRQALLALFYR